MTHGHTTQGPAEDGMAAEVDGLRVVAGPATILDGVVLSLRPGEVVGVAGETGSGKTTLGLAFLGFQRVGLQRVAGSARLQGEDLESMGSEQLRSVRGRLVAYVPQDPRTALNPALRVGDSVREVLAAHGVTDRRAQDERVETLFEAVGLAPGAEYQTRFPYQLSGGQQQRVAIAIGFALHPAVVVLDEPTTGLDAATKAGIVRLIHDLSQRERCSVLLISHDLRMLLASTDRIIVMRSGRIVEDAPSSSLPGAAQHPYTVQLLAALPDDRAHRVRTPSVGEPGILGVRSLSARYGPTVATQAVTLDLAAGKCLALVGESGSGKSTIARCIAGFHSEYEGSIELDGRTLARDVGQRPHAERRQIQYVFQNPYSSLNPRRTVGSTLVDAAKTSRGVSSKVAHDEAHAVLVQVGLHEGLLRVLPHALSGGQRQRAALARALLAKPRILICDEVTSSLDVSVQAGIIALLAALQRQGGLSMLFITHDLALVSAVADRTMVLQAGTIVEEGPTAEVIEAPRHAYTKMLLSHRDETTRVQGPSD
jgi:peptide/nickel transport system ATP-binding protein